MRRLKRVVQGDLDTEPNVMPEFVLEVIDDATGCIASDLIFSTIEEEQLRKIVCPDQRKLHPAATYEVSNEAAIQLQEAIGAAIPRGMVRLRRSRPLDGLSYKVHTNRELLLMLRREKPLSAFAEALPNPGFEIIPERHFSPHVESGRLVKREHEMADASGTTRLVLYALPSESWRMAAYILLKQTAQLSGWNEGFERLEGSLLGYQDWQNDEYLERIYRKH